MKNLLIFSLITVIVGFGCKKTEILHFSSSIVGEWSWIRTCGGFVGCVTPQSENLTINLIFTSDSIYRSYRNGVLDNTSRFHIYKVISADNKDTTNILSYGETINKPFLMIHDTLCLEDNNIIGSAYKRVR